MIPFSPDVFFALFEEYNLAIWPAQPVAYGLGLLVLALVFRPSRAASAVIGAILTAFWLWTGLVYHWYFFAPINFAASVFAALFGLQALLFFWRFLIRVDMTFAFRRDVTGAAGLTLMVLALAVFPLFEIAAGHAWPQSASFGLTPAPTVLFSFGAILLARPRIPLLVLVIPFLWTMIGTATAWLVGIPENMLLPAAALLSLIVIIRQRRRTA